MLFFTYNDPPGGIYQSQVLDVCNFMNKKLNANVRLLALISFRNFLGNKKRIREKMDNAIVIPMFPTIGLWKLNIFSLFFISIFLRKKKIMARGPFATYMSLCLRDIGLIKKVIFDARGAYAAEYNEYVITQNKNINKKISIYERKALIKSDFRLAVSDKLVQYWKEKYEYPSTDHVVVPCTITDQFIPIFPTSEEIKEYRKQVPAKEDDIVLVYSGSVAGWQSLQLLNTFFTELLKKDDRIKVLLLTPVLPQEYTIVNDFKGRVINKFVSPEKVKDLLIACDYGIMVRENSVTNSVASPTKFAEYLAAGLKVIISNNLGDYTEFVLKNDCGYEAGEGMSQMHQVNYMEKQRLHKLAGDNFKKINFSEQYLKILKI